MMRNQLTANDLIELLQSLPEDQRRMPLFGYNDFWIEYWPLKKDAVKAEIRKLYRYYDGETDFYSTNDPDDLPDECLGSGEELVLFI